MHLLCSTEERRHTGLERHEDSKCQNLTHNRASLQDYFDVSFNINIMLQAKKKNQSIFEISNVLFQFEVLHICDVSSNANAVIDDKIITSRSKENQDN